MSAKKGRYEQLDPATVGRLGPLIRREPRGMDLLARYSSHEHPGSNICHGEDCGLRIDTVGITALAYTYEICDCAVYRYTHLVEQLWHRDCLVDS